MNGHGLAFGEDVGYHSVAYASATKLLTVRSRRSIQWCENTSDHWIPLCPSFVKFRVSYIIGRNTVPPKRRFPWWSLVMITRDGARHSSHGY